jgi:hypothetical protein
VLVVLLLGFTLFPAFWMLSSAFDKSAGAGGQTLLPREWTLANFEYVLTEGGFDVFLRNSAIVALVTVLASAVLALLASVAVARFRFRFRTGMLLMILVVQMVPLEALVIPLFVQVRDLQLLNTLLGLMVVYVALSLPFGIWMLRGFVAAVPIELEEAAYIDGASWGRMFRSVLLPLVMPGPRGHERVLVHHRVERVHLRHDAARRGIRELHRRHRPEAVLRRALERVGLHHGGVHDHHDPRHDLLRHRAAPPLERTRGGRGQGMNAAHDPALRALVGGVLWPGFLGRSLPAWLRRELADGGLAGVVLFSHNLGDDAERAALAAELHSIRSGLVVGIDEEGGNVTRVEATTGSTLPSAAQLGFVDDPDATAAVGRALAERSLAVGANVVLAPVADVNTDPRNPVIGVRAFGDEPGSSLGTSQPQCAASSRRVRPRA